MNQQTLWSHAGLLSIVLYSTHKAGAYNLQSINALRPKGLVQETTAHLQW